ALGCGAEQAKRVLPGLDRVVEAAEANVEWSDHLPAAAVVRVLLEMRLDTSEQFCGRLVAAVHGSEARGQRLTGKIRRAEEKIGGERAGRHSYQRRRGNKAPTMRRYFPRCVGAGGRIGRGDQPAGNLDPRRLGLARRGQAPGLVAA